MGTGVGEAALAAEALGTAEAAGAIAGGAGIADAALLGGEYAGGLGLTGGIAEGLGSMGALGGEYGGLSSLAPAFQQATNATAVFNPETAAQVVQATNAGAVPSANAALGAGQIGDPALAQITQAFQNAPTSAQTAAMYGPGTQVAAAPGVGADSVMGDVLSKGSRSIYDLGATDMSLGAAGEANAAAAAAPSVTQAAGAAFDPSTMATINQGAGDIAAKSSFPFSNPLTSLYNTWKDQDPLTKGVTGGIAALQAAKYLNKPQGVAPIPGYSGPLSKFTYNPSTYTPYTYKPYAAGGPVEAMSNENAIGANTGYPQADIQHGAYATPWQTPISRNVVADAGDTGVDQMTGLERMARGGVARFDGGGEANGGDSGAAAGEGDTGIAALGPMMYSPAIMSSSLVDPAAAYATSQPAIDMSRQNFQNFLARYQNYPITEAASAAPAVSDMPGQPGPTMAELERTPGNQYYIDPYGRMGNNQDWLGTPSGSGGAKAGGLMASGGIANLGGYSDGGRLLKGPGDGMSDNIPANISGKQPARLADGEFVVPADVVSGLGNGSTDAGAKQLYKMLDKVRSARTGTKKQGKQIKPEKYTPA